MNKFLGIILLFFITLSVNAEIINDDFADITLENSPKPKTYTNYNYQSYEKYPVQLTITEEIKSEKDIYEGQEIQFRVKRNVVRNDKTIIQRGDIITANVKLIISSGMNGIPASIVFEDFRGENIKRGQFAGEYEVIGQDRTLLVYPLKWALTILPPTGSLTNFIMGGHAKIKPKKTITINYYPEWI